MIKFFNKYSTPIFLSVCFVFIFFFLILAYIQSRSYKVRSFLIHKEFNIRKDKFLFCVGRLDFMDNLGSLQRFALMKFLLHILIFNKNIIQRMFEMSRTIINQTINFLRFRFTSFLPSNGLFILKLILNKVTTRCMHVKALLEFFSRPSIQITSLRLERRGQIF